MRWWYQRNAYPEIGSRGAEVVERHDAALQLQRISDVQRQAVGAARGDFIRKDNRLSDDMIALLDEDRTSGGFMDFGRGGGGERGERRRKLRELRDEAETLRVAALDALKATLGPDLSETLAGKVAVSASEDQDEAPGSTASLHDAGFGPGHGGGPSWQGAQRTAPTEDSDGADSYLFLPGPITVRDVDVYPDRLGITEDNRVILEALYDDYREAHRQWGQDHLDPLRAHQQKLWAIDPDTNRVTSPSEEDIDRLFNMRSSALEALRTLDRGFFDNINLLITAPEGEEPQGRVERLRLARDRQIYRVASQSQAGGGNGRNPMMRFGGGFDGEAAVDILMLLDEIMLADSDLQAIDGPLSVWPIVGEDGLADGTPRR